MIKKIMGIIKLAIFLSWLDKDSRKVTLYLTSGLASCILVFWTFPLQNLTPTGMMSTETQLLLRIIGTESLIAGWLISLNRLIFYKYDKYKVTRQLSRQELTALSDALRSSSPIKLPNNLDLFEVAQKAYNSPDNRSKNAKKLVDTINSLPVSESTKHDLYEEVIFSDKGRPSKSNPFKKE